MTRLLEHAALVMVAIALTVSWERYDRAEIVDAQVAREITALERYVDEWRPHFERGVALGQIAHVLCDDHFAASQIERVQAELANQGMDASRVCAGHGSAMR